MDMMLALNKTLYQQVQSQFWMLKFKMALVDMQLIKLKIVDASPKSNYEELLATDFSILDLYYLEGMKLFNQGEFAINLEINKCELGVYL